MNRKEERKKQLFIRIIIGSLILVVLLTAGIFGYMVSHPLKLKKDTVYHELNEEFDPTKNIKKVYFGKPENVQITSDVDVSKTGDYPIKYTYRKHSYKAVVKVRDMTPPVLKVHDYETDLVDKVKPDFFVEEIKDDSKVTVKFEKEEEWNQENTYEVGIVAEDAGGNKTVQKAKLIRKKDEKKPEIQGVQDLTILQGKTIDFNQGIVVKDDMDPKPSLHIDSSKVDFATPGIYEAVYTARDRSGNEQKIVQKITVKENPEMKEKIVYLTFDDGPSDNTEKILDILKKYNAKATFFVTGNNQKKNDMIKRAHDEGHAIGLHTYTHDYRKVYASEQAYFDDLKKISDMVEKLTGEKSMLIRFPGGSSNTISKKFVPGLMTKLTKEVQEKGYQYFDWNCDSTDASGNNVPVERLVENATSGKTQHINILMHDTDAKDTTAEALPKIIEYYRGQGYAFKALTKDSFAPHHHVNN